MANVPKTTATRERFERRFVLDNVRWETYEALIEDLESSNVRLTYDRGGLEFVSPATPHERNPALIRRMIETLTEELDIPVRSGGSTTFRRALKGRGLEPDECYWIAHEPEVRGKKSIDPEVDPPPDLALEVENTRSILNKMSVYATLGFPEVWRYNGRTIRVARLQPDGTYSWGATSPTFPYLARKDLLRFLAQAEGMNETHWIRGFRTWVRDELAPRVREGADDGPHP